MRSAKGSTKLNDKFRFSGTNAFLLVKNLLDGVGVGTIAHIQGGVEKVVTLKERTGQ